MRKKIAVPITLAVFALAAFLSVGLLLTVNGGVTQAQGLPDPDDLDTMQVVPDDGECEVIIHGDDTDNPTVLVGAIEKALVSGGDCTASGDSVDVIFKNSDDMAAPPVGTKSIAVYVTGGEQFSSLQATTSDGKSLGAQGMDEYLRTVKIQTVGFSGNEPGTETVTVSRDMAKNGEVYLFVYLTADTTAEAAKLFVPDGIPLSGLVDDEVRSRTSEDNLLGPISSEGGAPTIVTGINLLRANAIAFTYDHDDDSDTNSLDFMAEADIRGVVTAAAPTNQPSPDDGEVRADVDNEQTTLDMAKLILTTVKEADSYARFAADAENTTGENNAADIATLEQSIREVQAAIDAIDGGDP